MWRTLSLPLDNPRGRATSVLHKSRTEVGLPRCYDKARFVFLSISALRAARLTFGQRGAPAPRLPPVFIADRTWQTFCQTEIFLDIETRATHTAPLPMSLMRTWQRWMFSVHTPSSFPPPPPFSFLYPHIFLDHWPQIPHAFGTPHRPRRVCNPTQRQLSRDLLRDDGRTRTDLRDSKPTILE